YNRRNTGNIQGISCYQSDYSKNNYRFDLFISGSCEKPFSCNCTPDGMRRCWNTIDSNPASRINFIHQNHIDVISKIMLVSKWLIKTRKIDKTIQTFIEN